MNIRLVSIIAFIILLLPASAMADVIEVSFYNLTNNSPTYDLSDQLTLSIYDPLGASDLGITIDPGHVLFVFQNLVGTPSSIHEIYMDDGTVLGLANVINSQDFPPPDNTGFTEYTNLKVKNNGTQDPSPDNLPGGEVINFVATDINGVPLSVDSFNGSGLDSANEFLGIDYEVYNGLDGIREALALGAEEGGLRIGLHVGGYPDGESDSYVNTVPEPSILLLLGLGIGAVSVLSKRFNKD